MLPVYLVVRDIDEAFLDEVVANLAAESLRGQEPPDSEVIRNVQDTKYGYV